MSRTSAPPRPGTTPPRSVRPGSVRAELAGDRIDAKRLSGLVLSLVAPLTVAAGVIVAAFAVTGQRSVPVAFALVAVALALFMPGYLAMTKYVTHAGVFTAFNARGLGRPVGVAAGLCALVAYGLLLVGLFGAFGVTVAERAAGTTVGGVPWWGWALAAATVVGVLGVIGVRITAVILGVLGAAEILLVIILTVFGLFQPAHGHVSLSALDPTTMTWTALGVGLIIAVTAFTGVEIGPVYAEESKDPHRTVRAATYTCLALMTVLYTGVGVALLSFYGDQVVTAAQKDGPAMLWALGPAFLSVPALVLFATSLFAAMGAFHQAVCRYLFSLGREHILPPVLGRTNLTGVPRNASLLTTASTVAVIAVFAVTGADPMTKLFFLGGTSGAFGVLALLAVTSASVARYFRTARHPEPPYRRVVLPVTAAVVLGGMTVLAAFHFAAVAGVPDGSALAWMPALYAVVAAAGAGWALHLRRARPAAYAAIGLGADAVAAPVTRRPTGGRSCS